MGRMTARKLQGDWQSNEEFVNCLVSQRSWCEGVARVRRGRTVEAVHADVLERLQVVAGDVVAVDVHKSTPVPPDQSLGDTRTRRGMQDETQMNVLGRARREGRAGDSGLARRGSSWALKRQAMPRPA